MIKIGGYIHLSLSAMVDATDSTVYCKNSLHFNLTRQIYKKDGSQLRLPSFLNSLILQPLQNVFLILSKFQLLNGIVFLVPYTNIFFDKLN